MEKAAADRAWITQPAMPGDAPAWLTPAVAVSLAAFLVLAFGPVLFGCGDTSWHIAAGDWIIAHRAVPHADPFSLTFAGRPWVANEWLAEVVIACAFAAGSWSGLGLLFAGLVASILTIVGASIGRHLAPAKVLVAIALVAAVLAQTALARPHVLGSLLLALWLDVLLRAREAERAPPPAAALLMLVWANLHGSFLFGLALAGALALEALVARARADVVRDWALFGFLALVAALATPNGVTGFIYPIQISAMRTLPLISEWQRTNFVDQPAFALLLAVGLYAVAKWRVRVPLVRMIALLATLALALAHARHQAIFAIVAPMLLAGPIGKSMAGDKPVGRQAWTLPLVLLACAAVAAAARLAVPAPEPEGVNDPVAMLDHLPRSLTSRPVLNGYGFGGPLIRRGIAPFIDGRADMYGDAFMQDYARIDSGDMAAFRKAETRYGIEWTILPPGSRLVAALDRDPGWRRLSSDKWAVVHVRGLGFVRPAALSKSPPLR